MEKTITSSRYSELLIWLKKARTDRQMSMRDLGEKIGRPHQFIGKVESGERRLDVYEFVQYCEALGVNEKEGLYLLSDKYANRNTKSGDKASNNEKKQ